MNAAAKLIPEVPPEPVTNGITVLSTLVLAGIADHMGGPIAAGFGWLFFLIPLFWIALFILIFSIFGRRWRHNGWGQGYGGGHYGGHHGGGWEAPSRSAEASLAERFAQGDIDEKEYRARLEVLRANSPHQPAVK